MFEVLKIDSCPFVAYSFSGEVGRAGIIINSDERNTKQGTKPHLADQASLQK